MEVNTVCVIVNAKILEILIAIVYKMYHCFFAFVKIIVKKISFKILMIARSNTCSESFKTKNLNVILNENMNNELKNTNCEYEKKA